MAALDPHDIAASLAGEFRIVPPALASTIAAHVGVDLGVHAPEHIAQAVASDLGVEPPAPGVPGQPLIAQKDRNRFDTEAMAPQPIGKHIAMSVAKDLGIDFGEAAPGPAGYGEEMARRALEETGRTGRAPLGMFAPGGMPEAGATLSDQEKQQKIAAGEMPQPATKEEAALQAGQTIQQMHGTGGFGGGGGIAAAGALGLGGIRGPKPVMAPEGKGGGAGKEVPAAKLTYSPAVRIEGKVYTGGSHVDAIERAAKRLNTTEDALIEKHGAGDAFNNLDGFVDSDGGFVSRADAYRQVETPPAPPPGPPPSGAPRTLGNLARRTFVSDTVDRYAAEAGASIRRETGLSVRESEQARAAIEPFHRTVNALDEPGKQSVVDYIEDPAAPRAQALPRDQQAFADTFRSIVQSRRAQLENTASTADMSFVDNYYTHNWTDPAQAQRVVNEWRGAVKEGSGRNLRERTVPTVAEGIKRGLVPKYGPIGTLLHYVDNMDRFIATNTIFDKAQDAGLVRYIPEGRPIPEGYAPVKGRLGNRGGQQAIAPDGWARVYNQYVSRGIYDQSPEIGEVYDKLRHGSNVLTQIKLGLSGYHWLTEAQTAVNDSWAGATDSLFAGHPGQAAARLAKGVVSPVRFATKGKQLEAVYLNKIPGTPQQRQIMNIITEAGGRGTATRHAPDYEMSRLGSYVTAFRRGALKAELAADKADVLANPAMGALKVGARHIGRIMSTIAQPLFEKYIPRIKNAAAAEHLEAWMERNPNATHEEQVAAARGIVDYVDDRYGEMIQDNIFMDKLVKQGATLALLSWSYRFGGIVRGIGKGLADTAVAPWRGARLLAGAGPPRGPVPQGIGGLRGKQFWTPQMSYIIGIALTNAAIAAIYQGLKTGEAPKDVRDLVAPRTGGKDQKGRPERLMLPGHIKDVYGLAAHPAKEVTGGSSPWIPFTTQSLSLLWGEGGKDWQGKPIISHSKAGHPWLSNVPTWLKQYFGFATQSLVPISASGLMKDNPKSGLSSVERVLGVRTAPSAIQTRKEYDPGEPKSRSQAVHQKIEEIMQQRGQKGVPPILRYGPGSHR